MEDSPICVYCGKEPGITSDHVPPKAFFPKPRPSNLRTVPACFRCNNPASRDEEYFLAALMFSNAGVTEPGKKLWREKLHRMYAKNSGIRRKIGRSLQHIEMSTPAGIYLGRGMGLDIEEPRLEAVAAKIVRGLHYIETDSVAPADLTVTSLFVREKRHHEAIAQHNHMLKSGIPCWPGIFQYRRGAVPEQPLKSMWLLWFWSTHIFWVITHPGPSTDAIDG